MMGDNRDLSLDSRYWGFVNENQIVGKPLFIYLSVDQPQEGSPHVRSDRFLKSIP